MSNDSPNMSENPPSPPTAPEKGAPLAPGLELLTVREVATMLRVSKMTVYRLIDAGSLRSLRIGHSLRLPSSSVREYLRDAQAVD